jgi:hypothetical protein
MPHVIAGNSAEQKDCRDVKALGAGLRRTAIGGAAELFASVAARPETHIFKLGGGRPAEGREIGRAMTFRRKTLREHAKPGWPGQVRS